MPILLMMRGTSTKAFGLYLILLGTAIWLTGCGETPFDAFQATGQIQGSPIQLDGEQVLIQHDQIACAERAELLVILPLGGNRKVGQWQEAGRALGFSDDIHIGDPGYPSPYTQVRGKFWVQVANLALNDVDENTKVAEAQAAVRIDHKCFAQPPRLMGVYKGQFSAAEKSRFEFRRRGESWHLAGLQH